ncbi:MAG: hypothetical protein IKB16_15955, partial [Lentisphaeria bacterium]|nr:hypothetical protein [Lentisphaeria bacterium]
FLIVAINIPNDSSKVTENLSQCTIYIFLLHTICAAGCRAVLLKLGIDHWVIHYIVGVLASFVAPCFAAWLMKKTKTDFLAEPGKYLKFKNKSDSMIVQ